MLPMIFRRVLPILLIPGALTYGQAPSYNPMFPPLFKATQYVSCVDINGYVTPNCNFALDWGLWTNTNAHFHDDASHPSSTPSPASGNTGSSGYYPLQIQTTLIAQAEWLVAYDVDNPNDPGSELDYAVGYNDVYYNDHPDIWIKIGGSDTGGNSGHGTTGYNRYMTSDAAYGLFNATQSYFAGHSGVTQLCTNDMALPFGGKFDICNQAYPGCTAIKPWQSPHIAHDRGTAADVAGPNSGQCPVANQVIINDFLAACKANGANSLHSIAEGNHAHCNWADPATYPH